MPVPEAPVNEDDELPAAIGKVGRAGEIRIPNRVAKPKVAQSPAH